ncbi:MAG: hypothetical protein ACTHQQ_03730 [Solirubrobacteraceae bacterium]
MPGKSDARWSRRANFITSRVRAVGGRLVVDGRQLRFEPHAIDRALAGKSWSISLDEVTAIQVVPARPLSHLFGAGLRRQLCVEGAGTKAFFIVNGADQAAEELRALTGDQA